MALSPEEFKKQKDTDFVGSLRKYATDPNLITNNPALAAQFDAEAKLRNIDLNAVKQGRFDIDGYSSSLGIGTTAQTQAPFTAPMGGGSSPGSSRPQSAFEKTLQGIPDLPKIDFSQLMRRRQVGTPEYAAQKAQLVGDAQRQQQLAARQLASQQAKSGVRGGAAGAQQARVAEQAQLQRAAAEQGLFAKNIAEREKLQKAQQFGDLSSALSKMQLASAELGQQRGLQAAADTAAAQRAAAAGAGGCCSLVAVTSAVLLGPNRASADYLILASKTEGVEIAFQNPSEKEFVRHLKGIRKIRDSWCSQKELRGYYRASEAMAPYFADSDTACQIFFKTWIKPTVACAEGKAGFFDKLLTKTWIKFFGLFGSDKPFTRSNGEIV